jgi:ATP-dependent helicase HrpB
VHVPRAALPIDPHLPRLVAALAARRAAVVVAAPGAGKTTRVPPALCDRGPVIVLQPRRIAARALARRVAEEQGWTVGLEAGWHVRDERRFTPATRVLFATEGILTARLQQDPLLSGFATVVLDEFHERSVHADLGLALARQAWQARNDLHLVVMSATLDASPLSAYLDDCPVISIPGEAFPIDIRHRPDRDVTAAVREALADSPGDVLCFLPGAREIDEARRALAAASIDAELIPLHGGLAADAQDEALRPGPRRRVVLATNIAETSLTVPRVRAVVDTGLQKIARYDAARGLDRLDAERLTQDAADQRAGRAGRLGPGLVLRLWDERDRLRPFREPEIRRVDLSPLALAVLCWGAIDEIVWLEAPDAGRLAQAVSLLQRLGLVDDHGRATADGIAAQRLPLHPRLARLLLAARGSREARLAAAALSELRVLRGDGLATACDVWSLVHDPERLPPHVRRAAERLDRPIADRGGPDSPGRPADEVFRRAVLAAYPDRVAHRRSASGPLLRLASGTGARLADESGVQAEWLVAVEVRATDGPNAVVALASGIDKGWLQPTTRATQTFVDDDGVVRAVEQDRYDALVLRERHVTPDASASADVLAEAWLAVPRAETDDQLLARLRFAAVDADLRALARRAAQGCRTIGDVAIAGALSWSDRQQLERDAPERLALPSGRTARLLYRDAGDVVASVKLQELFGLADTPVVGPRRVPVLLELLAPNGRPVQTTRDLRSFWQTTYAEVRKELRGRYPRHPWPEDPWTATPTHRTTRR